MQRKLNQNDFTQTQNRDIFENLHKKGFIQ